MTKADFVNQMTKVEYNVDRAKLIADYIDSKIAELKPTAREVDESKWIIKALQEHQISCLKNENNLLRSQLDSIHEICKAANL